MIAQIDHGIVVIERATVEASYRTSQVGQQRPAREYASGDHRLDGFAQGEHCLRDRFERLLVIKGPAWPKERAEAREAGLLADWDLRKVAAWPMSGTKSESVILAMRSRGHSN